MGEKRFAVLLCADDSDYVKKLYGGYFGMFMGMLGDDGETWDRYKVSGGEFPDDEELEYYDGFVITGSCSDAHSNDVWIVKLINLLKKLDSMKKKVLGICFGHQHLEMRSSISSNTSNNLTNLISVEIRVLPVLRGLELTERERERSASHVPWLFADSARCSTNS